MVVQHNLTAMNANRNLGITTSAQAKQTEKLSSGYRINRAADDAAGLSISEKMRRQIRGLTQASTNAQDGISMVQTAEGALSEVTSMLQRMNELTVKAANGTYTTTQKQYIADEINQLTSEIDRVATTTRFNDQMLLSGGFGTASKAMVLQVGNEVNETMKIQIHDMRASAITTGLNGSLTWSSAALSSITTLITNIKDGLEKVSSQRSQLGAMQNRLEHTISNLDNVVENTTAAESRVRDTDMAKAMVSYSNNQILAQAGQAMLAQANQVNQGVLSLIQ
ncbi:flagellin N-terminal helical domain-containing protein [Kineothrix sp. MB12-C1]|uniref:flagellin N-terminal helical domain-containing protein n=1 Tax=Kineothrix sp. MB12-C1 TaxID=3070215 RepID=UPI0027D203B7|nr:flagellin [Kineothrix sp. MB12-C1]WMC93885.1 flagellin [Kineothrix sp. MB12-C1]